VPASIVQVSVPNGVAESTGWVKADAVASVDAEGDEIRRFVVRRCGYDANRLERRHQEVAAFDDETEYRALVDALSQELQGRTNWPTTSAGCSSSRSGLGRPTST
jgi:hypothetical protein